MESKAKRVLFVLPHAGIGGTRTSLLNLISNMDRQRFDIHVLFLKHQGPHLKDFEGLCTLLPEDNILKAGRGSAAALIKRFDVAGIFSHIMLAVRAKLKGTSRYDLTYRLAARKYSDRYDCVISFQEKDSTEFVQYITAPRRIAWIHTDFSRTVRDRSEEGVSALSNRFDRVVFVSDAVKAVFEEKSHIEHHKMCRVYNTFDTESIIRKSTEFKVDRPENMPVLVSVGRFCEEKSFDRVVEAAYRLKNEGYRFLWYVIGDGESFDEISGMVKEKDIEDCVVLTGRKMNPYPYVACADAMVLTSVVESHPMVANEALILSKPVISTDFAAAREAIKDTVNGLLCDNSNQGVYNGVKRILDEPELLNRLADNLKNYCYDNAAIVRQVEDLIEGTR